MKRDSGIEAPGQDEVLKSGWSNRRGHLVDTWRRAMQGDTEALDALYGLVQSLDIGTTEGRAARRMAARAYAIHAKRVAASAASSDEPESLTLRKRARAYASLAFVCRLADHPLLRDGGRSGGAVPDSVSLAPPEASLLDPAPDAPTDVYATNAGGNTATVRWSVPNDHGKPITSYRITAVPPLLGGPTVIVAPATQGNVPALLPLTTYSFMVQAVNVDGPSLASVPSNPVTNGTNPPAVPANVVATPTGAVLVGTWTEPVGGPFGYLATLYDQAGVAIPGQLRNVASGAPLKVAYLGLATGSYIIGVRAIGLGGYGTEAQSAVANLNAALTQFRPATFHPFSSDPLLAFALGNLPLDPAVVRKRLSGAIAQGSKWRYEYLRVLATRAANDALQYESYIVQLMQLAVAKVSTAELIASPVLHNAMSVIEENTQQINNLATSADVIDVVQRLADAASTALLLESIVTWLIEYDPIDFWVGLFDKMIDDISDFDGNLPRTRNYLDAVFANTTAGTLGAAVRASAAQLKTRADAEIERLAAPLRAGVAQVVADTSSVMREVFQSFDNPLLMHPSGTGLPDVPNVDPLGNVLGLLTDAVESLITQIKTDVQAALDQVINTLGTTFRRFMIIYVCLPILAFLVISVAGGPFSAAALAAIVLVAAQKLIQLLARWLAGPILDKVDGAKRKMFATMEELQGIFARTVSSLDNPEHHLQLLASQLLEMKNLLPQAFLTDLAELIGEARRAVLASAGELALAAERAAGFEHATAFDAISTGYDTRVTPAPQLPGGTDASLLAGAAMLRDFNRLERERVGLHDGKEVLLTHRLSLYRLLGGVGDPVTAVPPNAGELRTFLSGGRMLLRINEESLLDAGFPGLYRALISDIRVTGVFAAAAPLNAALPPGVGLTLTHVGPSRTRIKRDSNPAAPPLTLPDCLPLAKGAFQNQVMLAATLNAVVTAVVNEAAASFAFQAAQVTFFWFLFKRRQLTGPTIRTQVHSYVRLRLAEAIANAIVPASCGALDRGAVIAALRSSIDGWPWATIPECHPSDVTVWIFSSFPPLQCPTRAQVAAAINNMNPSQLITNALQQIIGDAYDNAVAAYAARIAKWGNAYLIEDRDPQVRSLGFVTLAQQFEPESAVYNLLPDGTAFAGRFSDAPPLPAGQAPVTAMTTQQYRPFENRGLEGDLVLTIDNTARAASLADVILEIDVRACYDDDLAATVRSSLAQNAAQLALANVVAGTAGNTIVLPGMLPELAASASNVRTVHFSARGHRDKLLRAAIVAAESVAGGSPVDGLAFDPALLPLQVNQPLSGVIAGALQVLTLQFQKDQPTSLGSLNSVIAATPTDVGIAPSLLTSGVGRIVSLGVAVIPTQAGIANGVQMASIGLDAPIQPLLPQVSAVGFNLATRLVTTTPTTGLPVLWRDVWNAAAPPKLAVDFGAAITNGWIYDVIFSVSLEMPVPSVIATVSTVA